MSAAQEVNSENIPAELKQYPNWVMWKYEGRDGRRTKPLYDANANGKACYAKSNDPSTWASFDVAFEKYDTDETCFYDGIGIVLKNTPLIGVDFDGVIAEGKAEPYVLEILKQLGNPYAEITPSGSGIRAFVQGVTLPERKRKFSSNVQGKYGAEIYSGSEGGRYLTVTGKHFSGSGIPTLQSINLAYFLISQITNTKLKALWMGDMSAYEDDHSSSDLALLGILNRLFNGDAEKMEKYFSASALGKRDKWTTRADYRERTIQAALKPSVTAPAPAQEPATAQSPITPIVLYVDDATDFVLEKLPARLMLLKPFLAEKTIGMVHAWRGVGKTHIMLGMATATASGGKFLKWEASKPSPVLYVDGEMADEDIQLWMREAMQHDGVPPIQKGFLNLIAADRQDKGIPTLSTPEGQRLLEDAIGDAKTVYFDNISCLFRGGDEREGMDWESAQEWLISLRRQGISTVLGHHDGKQGFQRGTSKREDPMNWVIQLKHPKNYQPEEGLRCEIQFEKARRLFGVDARSFEAALVRDENGKATWAVKEMADALADAVKQMHNEQGMSFRDIGKHLDISKSWAEQLYKKPVSTELDADVGF